MLACVAVATLLNGCQQESAEPESPAITGQNGSLIAPVVDLNSTPKQQPDADTTPQQIVTQFLQALCQGDADAVTQLLTEKARVETKKHQLAVQPPGTAAAQYQVGKVELVEGGAYVNSIWSEPATDGNRQRWEWWGLVALWHNSTEPRGGRGMGRSPQAPTQPHRDWT